ncbi:hypothetical protein BAT02nite_40980 [Bacillus atrophaeus]|nr:hypothetical protein [Bacillus atrophaeus]KXZ13273.1 hypothetical protein AXI57_16085 [Bacillus atrophaeus]UFD97651.1 hypothetical protein [Bacillus atrophaeus]GED04454.1 hypothetical protein BAT02nite_40980 [Bacillus atrophaeus]
MISLTIYEILTRYKTFEELCEALDSCFDLHDLGYVDKNTQANYIKLSEIPAIDLLYMWKQAKKDKSLPPYAEPSNYEKAKIITIYTYVGELIPNENGIIDHLGCAWFTVPSDWAENKAKQHGYVSLSEFQSEYIMDDTAGWLLDAITSSSLLNCGVGRPRITKGVR